MADYAITGETIFPSGYDIAGTAGDGVTMREVSLTDNWLKLTSANNFTVSGLVIPGSSGTLALTIPLGVAYLAGRYLNLPATAVTCTASNTNYIFLKVARDGSNNVTGAWYEVNLTGTPPADATPIASAIAGGSTITSTVDNRLLGPGGLIILSSGTSWIVKAGLTRITVEVLGAGGGGGGGGGTANVPGNYFGGTGGTGGTTTFSTLLATGGTGGIGGDSNLGGGAGGGGATGGSGIGSGGTVSTRGRGNGGGPGGAGGTVTYVAKPGGPGGDGGYACSVLAVTPAATITYAIGGGGAAGTGGPAGAGGGTGAAGSAGGSGLIVIRY